MSEEPSELDHRRNVQYSMQCDAGCSENCRAFPCPLIAVAVSNFICLELRCAWCSVPHNRSSLVAIPPRLSAKKFERAQMHTDGYKVTVKP
jgi:hypothetical protein